MSKNLYVPVLQKKGRQKKSRPDGRLEQSLKIWWRPARSVSSRSRWPCTHVCF
jgi:hypothetical protein